MTKQFTNNFVIINLHKKPSIKSEVVTQMLYGDSFSILKKSGKWLKIKIKEDGYKGYIKNNNFPKLLKSTHKVSILKSNIYKFPDKRMKINEISFGSKIKVERKKLKIKDRRYLFINEGYNLRPTELNASFCIEQLKKKRRTKSVNT